MNNFNLQSIGLGVLILLASRLVIPFYEVAITTTWMVVVGFYSCLNILFSWCVKRAKKASPLGFSVAVNGITLAKMFLTLGIIMAYLLADQPHRTQFAIGVFTVFAMNSAFFVIYAQKLVRKG